MKTRKVLHLILLDRTISNKLMAEAKRTGRTKAAIMSDAVQFMSTKEFRDLLQGYLTPALNGVERQLGKIATLQEQSRDAVDLTMELLRCFIQHQLTLSAHEPPFDAEAIRVGKERFARLLDYVEGHLEEHGFKSESKKLH